MPNGDCFRCHKPGHWANQCPLKTPTMTTTPSPPVFYCPSDGGACVVLTSTTDKNPNRKFYKCSSSPICKFFKWCDEVIVKSEPLSVNPTCPCGSGPCRKVTDDPNAHRSYFVCCIKKGFGACGFFQWEDEAKMTHEAEDAEHSDSPCSTLIRFLDFDSAADENLVPETCDANVNSSSLGMDFSNSNHLSNGRNKGISPSFDLITEDKDVIRFEREDQVLSSLASKHITHQVEFNGKEKSALEMLKGKCILNATGLSQNTSDPVLYDTNKPERQSTTSSENMDLFSGSFSLMSSEKLRFESVSMTYVDVLAAFTGSYKKLESLRGREDSLKKELLEVERQVRLYEADTSKFGRTLQEVSCEMVKSQMKVAEAVRVLQAEEFCSFVEKKKSKKS